MSGECLGEDTCNQEAFPFYLNRVVATNPTLLGHFNLLCGHLFENVSRVEAALPAIGQESLCSTGEKSCELTVGVEYGSGSFGWESFTILPSQEYPQCASIVFSNGQHLVMAAYRKG